MLRTTLAASVLAASAAAQQVDSPIALGQMVLGFVSEQCRTTITGLINSTGDAYQCLQIDSLIPALTTNDSIIAPVDNYLSEVCYNEPCPNSTFNQTVNAILSGCSKDLNAFGISNSTVLQYAQYDTYLLARDVACLKTNNTQSLENATIAANDTSYNTTNGTFCVTDLATDLSAYLGVNLTNSYVDTVALGGNGSALRTLQSIPPTALCNDCIFAAVELINEGFPAFGQIVVNRTANYTIDAYLNSTCAATPYNVTNDGMLPDSIVEAAVNGTMMNGTMMSNETMTMLPTASAPVPVASGASAAITSVVASAAEVPSAAASAASAAASAVTPARRAMAEKKRWFGA